MARLPTSFERDYGRQTAAVEVALERWRVSLIEEFPEEHRAAFMKSFAGRHHYAPEIFMAGYWAGVADADKG